MSDSEIEKAAMGPRRWIELCGRVEKDHLNDHGVILRPRTTRIINDSLPTQYVGNDFFIVPGGRYLVGCSHDSISVLDLGYTSSADCKLVASVGLEGGYKAFTVQATPDGMGLIIFLSTAYDSDHLVYWSMMNLFFRYANCSVYEIYPESEMPHLTQVAHLQNDFDPSNRISTHLLPGTVIWFSFYRDRIVFRVWDYRLNHSISFSVDVDVEKYEFDFEVYFILSKALKFSFLPIRL
jgi:hypothetical protein